MSETRDAVRRVLSGGQDPDDDEVSAPEAIEDLIAEHGWPAIRAEMLDVLRTYERPGDWHAVTEVLWGAALDGREMDADEVIAHVYYRLPREDDAMVDDADNIAWSIALRLKREGSVSKYEPLRDAGVTRVLERLRRPT
jgi:hypothetical protein